MEETQGHRQRANEVQKGWQRKAVEVVCFFVESTFSYTLLATIAIVFIMGSLSFWEVVVPDNVPEINAMLGPKQLEIAEDCPDPDLTCSFNSDKAYFSLRPTLQILDIVCPESSHWFRKQYENGKIIWTTEDDGSYARYKPLTGEVVVNAEMFVLKNGERACTIAHEFRHSRQNLSKYFKLTTAYLLTGKHNSDIIENDAYLYESQVRSAINGR